jgi:hypothetical protein
MREEAQVKVRLVAGAREQHSVRVAIDNLAQDRVVGELVGRGGVVADFNGLALTDTDAALWLTD